MFDTHKLNDQGFKEMREYKERLAYAVNNVLQMMPEGREKAIFKTKIEESVFFGAKAIASKPGNYTEIIKF